MDAIKLLSKVFFHGPKPDFYLKFSLRLNLFLILVDANLANKQLNITQLELLSGTTSK